MNPSSNPVTDGIAQFKRMMQANGRTRKDLWRRVKPLPPDPTDSLSLTGPSRNGERPAPHLGKQQELFMDAPTATVKSKPRKRPSGNSGGTVTQAVVNEVPPVVNQVEVDRNTAAPIQLGAELEAALAAKQMEGVLEFFKNQVRGRLIAAGVTAGESEHAEVAISGGGGPSRVVNYDKFLDACREKGTKKIPVAARNGMIRISKEDLEEYFGDKEIDAMCDDGPPATAACKIGQKKTLVTPIGVPDAIKILHNYFQQGLITDKTFLKKNRK